MKAFCVMSFVLPVTLLVTACGQKPDPGSVSHKPVAQTASADQKSSRTAPEAVTSASSNATDVTELQAEKAALEAEKSSLVRQKSDMSQQKTSFAQPGAMNPAALGDFMADAQVVAVDQAKLDKVIQAAMDMDLDALQKALEDLLADLQAQIDDLQAQIDDLQAQIEAAP